jgi:hypothetical protein
MVIALGRGIRAIAMTAIGDLARLTIGLPSETVWIAAHNILMPTAGASKQIRGAVRLAFHPAEMDSGTLSPGYSRHADQRLFSTRPAGHVAAGSTLTFAAGEAAAGFVVASGGMTVEMLYETGTSTETDPILGPSEAANGNARGTETGIGIGIGIGTGIGHESHAITDLIFPAVGGRHPRHCGPAPLCLRGIFGTQETLR